MQRHALELTEGEMLLLRSILGRVEPPPTKARVWRSLRTKIFGNERATLRLTEV